jgi:hypothetical protein
MVLIGIAVLHMVGVHADLFQQDGVIITCQG